MILSMGRGTAHLTPHSRALVAGITINTDIDDIEGNDQ